MQINIKKTTLVECGNLVELIVTKVIDILPAGIISDSGISMALRYSKMIEITEESIEELTAQINEEFIKIKLIENETLEIFIHDDIISDMAITYTNATNIFFNIAKKHSTLVLKVINVSISAFNFFKSSIRNLLSKSLFDSAIRDMKHEFEEEIANELSISTKWANLLTRK